MEEVKDLLPTANSHPQMTPPEVTDRIAELTLKRPQAEQLIDLTSEQLAFIEKQPPPRFREHHVESSRLGKMLLQ